MPQSPSKLGKSKFTTKNKIVVKLAGEKLPKIGSRAKIQKKGSFIDIGEVIEIIGLTKSPWAVIRVEKKQFDILKEGEIIFTGEKPHREKGKKRVKGKKGVKFRQRKEMRS